MNFNQNVNIKPQKVGVQKQNTQEAMEMSYLFRLSNGILSPLDKKKVIFKTYLSDSLFLEQKLENWCRIELTYASNAVDLDNDLDKKNILSRREIESVLRGHVFRSSPIAHKEAKNHADTWDWIRKKAESDKSLAHVNEDFLREINRRLFNDIDSYSTAGRYRRTPARIAGFNVVLPNYFKIPLLLNKFFQLLREYERVLHPVELAAFTHLNLVSIHPFHDGNGRTARLMMNLILLIFDFPPAFIDFDKRLIYLESLEKAQSKGLLNDFYHLISDVVNQSLDAHLQIAQNNKTY